jgi:hypothetical protein
LRGPEKWAAVFGKDHAQTKSWSGMIRLKSSRLAQITPA